MNKSTIYTSSKDEYYTPQSVIDYVNSIAKIELDPCTTKINATRMGIPEYFDKEIDGLSQSWANKTIWLNPPFSEKEKWLDKARHEVNNNNAKVFVLLPMSFETSLWRTKILGYAKLHIPTRRITFIDGDTMIQENTNISFELTKSAPFGSCIAELTKEPNTEYHVFNLPPRGKQ